MRFFKGIRGHKCHWFHGSQELPIVVQGLSFLECDNRDLLSKTRALLVGWRPQRWATEMGQAVTHFPWWTRSSSIILAEYTASQPDLRPFCMQHIFSMPSHKETQVSGLLDSILSICTNIKIPVFKKSLKQLQNCLWPKEELCGPEESLVLVMVSLKLNP